MGVKQTKFEGSYLPETPTLRRVAALANNDGQQQQPLTIETDLNGAPEAAGVNLLDPRSPNGCRTPISVLCTQPAQTQQASLYQQQSSTTEHSAENTLSMMRKRFFKNFSFNLHDPRSPSMQLNRTPLVFDELNDKTLNLDDTFADLFVESRAPIEPAGDKFPQHVEQAAEAMQVDLATQSFEEQQDDKENVSIEINSFVSDFEEETMPCPAKLEQTPVALQQQQLDPRSPTIGVDRTPILFSDDDEINEDAMLENILATLTLNLSSSSSVASFNTMTMQKNESGAANFLGKSNKPANKHLERVRRNGARQKPQRQQKCAQRRRQRIYEDRENITSPGAENITPKKRSNQHSDVDSPRKRTPLSCVKNRTHLRSRSVESSEKSLKTRLPLSSFDDSLNPMLNSKVSNIHILQSADDSLEI